MTFICIVKPIFHRINSSFLRLIQHTKTNCESNGWYFSRSSPTLQNNRLVYRLFFLLHTKGVHGFVEETDSVVESVGSSICAAFHLVATNTRHNNLWCMQYHINVRLNIVCRDFKHIYTSIGFI